MKRCCHALLLGLVIAVPRLAVGADAPPAIIDLTISSGARLLQHFHDSIYFKVCSSPSLAAVRAKFEAVKPQAQEQVGFDPYAAPREPGERAAPGRAGRPFPASHRRKPRPRSCSRSISDPRP